MPSLSLIFRMHPAGKPFNGLFRTRYVDRDVTHSVGCKEDTLAQSHWDQRASVAPFSEYFLIARLCSVCEASDAFEGVVEQWHSNLRPFADAILANPKWLREVFGVAEENAPLGSIFDAHRTRKGIVKLQSDSLAPDDIRVLQYDENESLAELCSPEELADLLDLLGLNGSHIRQQLQEGQADPDVDCAVALSPREGPTIDASELGPFLKRFCSVDSPLQKRQVSLEAFVSSLNSSGLPVRFPDGRDALEQFQSGKMDWQIPVGRELEDLVAAYGVPKIMVEWMAARPREGLLVQDLGTHFSRMTPEEKCTRRCSYQFPEERLANLDAAVLLCVLEGRPGADEGVVSSDVGEHRDDQVCNCGLAHSNPHYHPGDELVWVHSGMVDVHIRSSGVVSRLTAGDLIHFEAEQPHVVVNPGPDEARMFTIRFWDSRRQQLREDLNVLTGNPSHQTDRRQRRVNQYLRRMLSDPHQRLLTTPRDVVDGRSLVVRINSFLDANRQLNNPTDFEEKLRGRFGQLVDHMLDGDGTLLHSKLDSDDLAEIRSIFGKDMPRVLFDDALVPAIPRCAVIRRSDGWIEPPPHDARVNANSRYFLPCRKLAGSRVELNLLEFENGLGESTMNRHPGFELILVLEGSVHITVCDDDRKVEFEEDVSTGSYAGFSSEKFHQLRNTSQGTTKVLVMRALRWESDVARAIS